MTVSALGGAFGPGQTLAETGMLDRKHIRQAARIVLSNHGPQGALEMAYLRAKTLRADGEPSAAEIWESIGAEIGRQTSRTGSSSTGEQHRSS